MPNLVQQAVEQSIYDNQESSFRYHLGASIIGGECERAIWYGWRWFKEVKFKSQMVRLFARGHAEELIVLEHMRKAGIVTHTVNPSNGEQFRLVALGGHFGGSLDGVLTGLLDFPDDPALFECKTGNLKAYKGLLKAGGVRQGKHEHYVQMQIYMKAYKLPRALYVFVCKDNDEWWWEWVEADDQFADNYMQRAANIIASDRAPLRLSKDPAWFICKWCDYNEICHYDGVPDINCRTCGHSEPRSDGRWHCTKLPEYKIRTNEEAKAKNKSINHMPCSGLEYERLE